MSVPPRGYGPLLVAGAVLGFGLALGCSAESETKGGPESRPEAPRLGEWFTDYDAAREHALKGTKMLMVLFTGSDWCPPCKKLKEEILDTPEFAAWATENVVLLELDFPRKRPVDPAIMAKNNSFARILNVTGFPTAVFMTPNGNEMARIGYQPGGPLRWIKELEKGLPVRDR
jgi:thiol:disulfide interchange protein